MNLDLTEAQLLLQRNARGFLEDACPQSLVREVEFTPPYYSRPLWRNMAELGWVGLAIPEDSGGLGGGPVDLAVLAEQMGRVNAPVPWLSTAVLGAGVLSAAGGQDGLLRRVADGEAVLAVAVREADLGYGPNGIRTRYSDGVLTGEKRFVEDAAAADMLIVAAREGAEVSLFRVDVPSDGLRVVWEPTTAGNATAWIALDAVRPVARIGESGQGLRLLAGAAELATAVLCWWMLGAAERGLEMAVAYAKERVQFGRPIGSFQAISHKLADVRCRLDGIRMLATKAMQALATGEDVEVQVSMAKAYTNEGVRWAMHRCHEVFAGIGFMEIHDLQLYYRRMRQYEVFLGDANYHRNRVAQARVLA